LTPRERNIAMVFQSYALYPHMTVYKNMAFNLELSGKPKAEIAQRVAEAARMLELEPLLDRKPSQLSGGQRQRVAMGRAVVRDPSVFLFDEPLSNLDAKLRVQMRAEIKALHRKVGKTSIYVTHDQVEAMTLADRVVVLSHGVIQQVGKPMELYRRPANVFVAGFIGSPAMNFVEATVEEQGVLRTDDGVRLAFVPESDLPVGHKVTAGIRPEQFALGAGDSTFEGVVEYVEPTGGLSYVMLAVGAKQVMVVVSGSEELDVGQKLTVSIASGLVHVFDGATGARVSR
jgi:multiple sugar transport system ATP-binding protein